MATCVINPEKLNVGIVAFYDLLATELYGKTFDHYDCTKVEVGKEVFNKIEEYYRAEKNMPKEDFAMLWCCYGPKATLDGYQVQAKDDWATDDDVEWSRK